MPVPSVINFEFESKAYIGFVEIRKLILQEVDYYKSLDFTRFSNLKQITMQKAVTADIKEMEIVNLTKVAFKI